MKQAVIYKITSPSNKIYIGQTKDWIKRRSNYKRLACKYQTFIYNSLIKYGYDNHILEIVESFEEGVNQDVLNNREIYWWKYYKDQGYIMMNLKEPGVNGSHSKEVRIRISNTLKGRKRDPEAIEKTRLGLLGRKLSNETKEKLRKSNTGKKHPSMTGTANHMSKKVLDKNTGKIFNTVREAESFYSFKFNTLAAKLNGRARNNTNLIYI